MARRRRKGSTTANDKPENGSLLASMATGSDYDLMRLPQDFLRWRNPVELYFLQRIIPIDHWFEERKPKERGEDDWVEVLDEAEENTVFQVIASMIRPATTKTQGMIDGKKLIVDFSPQENPQAYDDDRHYAGMALTDIWRRNDRTQLGSQMREPVRLTMLRGTYFRQSELIADIEDDQYSDDCCPLRMTIHDPLDVSWDVGPDYNVQRIILRKTVTWSMVPEDYRERLDLEREPAWDRQLRMYEIWTNTHHGVLINGRIAKPMTPHHYPRCPFTVGMHFPTPMRQHMSPPRAGQWQPQTPYVIGRPVCEELLQPAEVDSRLMTALMESVKRTATIPLVTKGLMIGPDEDVIDHVRQGHLALEDSVTSDARYPTMPDAVSNGLRFKQEYDKRTTDVAGAAPEQYSGQTKDRLAGVAQSEMTSWTRAAAEAIRTTISEEAARHVMLQCEILSDYYRPSTKRKIERDAPELIEMLGDMLDLPTDDGKPYPEYERLTGDKECPIDGYTFAFLREPTIKIPPAQLFSIEQGHNVGLQIANLPPERMLLSRQTILERYLQVENVESELQQVHTEELMADPELPIGKLLRLQAWVKSNPELGSHYIEEIESDIAKAIPQAVKQSVKAIVQQFMPAPDLPGGAQPMGQGMPMGGGAPGGPVPPAGPPQAHPPIPQGGPPPAGAPVHQVMPPHPAPQGGPMAAPQHFPGPVQAQPPVPMRGGGAPPQGGPPQAAPPRGILPAGFPPQQLGAPR